MTCFDCIHAGGLWSREGTIVGIGGQAGGSKDTLVHPRLPPSGLLGLFCPPLGLVRKGIHGRMAHNVIRLEFSSCRFVFTQGCLPAEASHGVCRKERDRPLAEVRRRPGRAGSRITAPVDGSFRCQIDIRCTKRRRKPSTRLTTAVKAEWRVAPAHSCRKAGQETRVGCSHNIRDCRPGRPQAGCATGHVAVAA